MGREQNRRLEREVFDLLRASLPDLAAGGADHGEAPEFVVTTSGARLGLEVTSLHSTEPGKGSPEVSQYAAGGLFFHLIDEFVRTTDVPCVVSIQLMDQIRDGKRRARELAEAVIGLLVSALARSGQSSLLSRLHRDAELPPELHSLELHWPPAARRPMVLMGGGGFRISGEFEVPLREVLAAKARKFEAYSNRCDRCWLAIVLPHYFEAEDEGTPSPALTPTYESPFERVLLVDANLTRFWSLTTCRDVR